MTVEYEPEAYAPYIQIREVSASGNIDIEEGVGIDIDTDHRIVDVDILDPSKRLSASDLAKITVEKLPLEPANPSLARCEL